MQATVPGEQSQTFEAFRLITCRFLQATVPGEQSQNFEAFRLITCRFLQATVPGEQSQTFEASVHFYMQIFVRTIVCSLIPRPHPLTRRNDLVNHVKILGLVYTFMTV